MAPKLYATPGSPPVVSVLICAKALGLELDVQKLNMKEGEHLKPEFLKINPQHTVPTLVDDDGFVVWDSHAILTYLVNKYGKDSSLYPSDFKKRATVDQRLHFDSNVLYPRGLTIIKSLIFQGATKIDENEKKQLLEAYGFVEKFLEGNEFIAGNIITVADISFITSIRSFASMVPLEESKYPKTNAWLRKMEKFPSSEAFLPGLTVFQSIVKSKLSN